ncbi:hypothetical protein G4B88_002916 [Cannabis sativa]|uniref:Uncharacterized protein n=1 Tax=Cannabis sativa TaxID=3483 RepID=A0A7J6GFM2_CANSA|nr:hypothetical protein G4B88_002916 [Cannabis sativa]
MCGREAERYYAICELLYPSAMSFMHNSCNASGSNILVVAEGCQLTLWDLRMKTNGSCFQWICGAVGDIYYAVCSSTIGKIAIGGADRTVTIYDPRNSSDGMNKGYVMTKKEVALRLSDRKGFPIPNPLKKISSTTQKPREIDFLIRSLPSFGGYFAEIKLMAGQGRRKKKKFTLGCMHWLDTVLHLIPLAVNNSPLSVAVNNSLLSVADIYQVELSQKIFQLICFQKFELLRLITNNLKLEMLLVDFN